MASALSGAKGCVKKLFGSSGKGVEVQELRNDVHADVKVPVAEYCIFRVTDNEEPFRFEDFTLAAPATCRPFILPGNLTSLINRSTCTNARTAKRS